MKKKLVKYDLIFNENPDIFRCVLIEGEYIDEWVEISNIKFLGEQQSTVDISFDFNSSLGDTNKELLQIAKNILHGVLNELQDHIKNENRG